MDRSDIRASASCLWAPVPKDSDKNLGHHQSPPNTKPDTECWAELGAHFLTDSLPSPVPVPALGHRPHLPLAKPNT